MSKAKRTLKAKRLVEQAISALADQSDHNVIEARSILYRAIRKLEQSVKPKQTNDQYAEWWGHIEAGVADGHFSAVSAESRERSLKELQNMIGIEQDKLKDLEEKNQVQQPDQLLRE